MPAEPEVGRAQNDPSAEAAFWDDAIEWRYR
jgi:hypothetical protein